LCQINPALLYSGEKYTLTKTDARNIKETGIKYMRITAGFSWTDYKSNTAIAMEVNITPFLHKI
jgi:hypothetical protein